MLPTLTMPCQEENASLAGALAAADARLLELEGTYDLVAASDSLNAAALAEVEDQLAAARCSKRANVP